MLESIRRLDAWLVSHNYQAYDPFDGLNAWLRPLAVGHFGKQLLQQGVRRFPYNLRHCWESARPPAPRAMPTWRAAI